MPIIGDSARFAIEYKLDDSYGGVWLFGKLCFWICNHQVGNFHIGVSLRDFLFQIEQGRRDHGRRMNTRFNSMTAKAVLDTIDGTLYGTGDYINESIAIEEQWARHNLAPAIDIFDQWKIYIVESDRTARIIYCCTDTPDDVRECFLPVGECDRVLNQACKKIGLLYDEERKKQEASGDNP